MIEAEGIDFYGISAGKIRRYWDLKNFTDFFKVPFGIIESYKILKKLKPDLIFAKGGYVSVPVIFAACALGIPVWMHESDVSPGLANKICAKFADRIFLSFEESRLFFKNARVSVVGNPIREEILRGDLNKGCKFTGFSKDLPVILVVGGSTGARSLNQLVYEILPELLKKTQVIHITGQEAAKFLPSANLEKTRYRAFEFLGKELADCYAIADLVVSRAGSGSIFEVAAVGRPLLLIPLPRYASRGDQIENAACFANKGFAFALDQETLSPQQLKKTIFEMMKDKVLREKMVQSQKIALQKDAAHKIAQEIFSFQKSAKA